MCQGVQKYGVSWSPTHKGDKEPGKMMTVSITKSSETERLKSVRSSAWKLS